MAGALAATMLVVAISPAAGGAKAPQAAPASMTPGEHLATLAKYGNNYLARLRPEVVQRLSAGGQTLIKIAQDQDKVQRLAANAPAALMPQRRQAASGESGKEVASRSPW